MAGMEQEEEVEVDQLASSSSEDHRQVAFNDPPPARSESGAIQYGPSDMGRDSRSAWRDLTTGGGGSGGGGFLPSSSFDQIIPSSSPRILDQRSSPETYVTQQPQASHSISLPHPNRASSSFAAGSSPPRNPEKEREREMSGSTTSSASKKKPLVRRKRKEKSDEDVSFFFPSISESCSRADISLSVLFADHPLHALSRISHRVEAEVCSHPAHTVRSDGSTSLQSQLQPLSYARVPRRWSFQIRIHIYDRRRVQASLTFHSSQRNLSPHLHSQTHERSTQLKFFHFFFRLQTRTFHYPPSNSNFLLRFPPPQSHHSSSQLNVHPHPQTTHPSFSLLETSSTDPHRRRQQRLRLPITLRVTERDHRRRSRCSSSSTSPKPLQRLALERELAPSSQCSRSTEEEKDAVDGRCWVDAGGRG